MSCTWGDSHITDEISCNGQGLRVTTSRLRYPSRSQRTESASQNDVAHLQQGSAGEAADDSDLLFNALEEPETAKEFQTVQRFHSLFAILADSDSPYVNGDSLPEALGRTLIADLDQYPPTDIVDSFGKWRQWIESDDPSLDGDSAKLFRGGGTFPERQFALTEKGCMCLVPAICAESDVICILSGRDAPFVLGKMNEFYALLDECHVHGFMYDEAFSKSIFNTGNEKSGTLDSLTQGPDVDSATSMNETVSSNGPTILCSLSMEDDFPPGWTSRDENPSSGRDGGA